MSTKLLVILFLISKVYGGLYQVTFLVLVLKRLLLILFAEGWSEMCLRFHLKTMTGAKINPNTSVGLLLSTSKSNSRLMDIRVGEISRSLV